MRRHWCLAGGVLCAVLGCRNSEHVSQSPLPPPPQQPASLMPAAPNSAVRKKNDTPSPVLLAKPSSCVSVADFYAQCAADDNRAQGERDHFAAEARKTYRRALQQDSKYLPAFLGLGRLAESLGEHADAVASYDQALAIHPKEATLWFERGVSLSRMKRYSDALASYQRAAQIDSKNKAYIVSAGYMLALLGRTDEAVAWMKKAMPESSARYNLAVGLKKHGMDDAASHQLALALQLDPNHQASHELLSQWQQPGRPVVNPSLSTERPAWVAAAQVQPLRPVPETPVQVIEQPAKAVPVVAELPQRPPVANSTVSPVKREEPVEFRRPPMPLIPVLSEHWERKPPSPPALRSLPPVSETKADKAIPAANGAFEVDR